MRNLAIEFAMPSLAQRECSYLHVTTAVAVDAEPNTSEELEQYGRPLACNPELARKLRQVGTWGSIVQFDVEYPVALTMTQVSPLKSEMFPLGFRIVTECVGLNVKV